MASYFPVSTLIDDLFRTFGGLLPPAALQLITDQLTKISDSDDTGLLTLGMLLAVTSSSAAMTAVIDTLNHAYGVEESRPWWRVRLVAIALTVGLALFILVSFALVLAGPTLATRLADVWRLGPLFEWTWKILQWPVVFALVGLGITLVYYFAPDAEQRWVWLTPGAVLATILWLLASLGFRYYVAAWGRYTETYGLIGAVMILLLWFYLSGLAILLGAELNATLEHASSRGKNFGEKVPRRAAQDRRAAMKKWIARRRRQGQGSAFRRGGESRGGTGSRSVVSPRGPSHRGTRRPPRKDDTSARSAYRRVNRLAAIATTVAGRLPQHNGRDSERRRPSIAGQYSNGQGSYSLVQSEGEFCGPVGLSDQ